MWISLIIILILSIATGLYFHREAIECLAFSTFGLIFLLYLFGIFGFLGIGLYIVYIITLICSIYIIYKIFYQKKEFVYLQPLKLIPFVGIIIFLYVILDNSRLICYDEFTAWGLFAKSMFYTDDLYILNQYPIVAKSYQSATALFQYFVTKTNGEFSETLLLSSMHILFFSMTFSSLKNLKSKNVFEIIIRLILIFLIPFSLYMWPAIYYTILVDFILGITFGYIIYFYFTNEFDKFLFLNLSFAIFFLTCSKGNGLVLAILSLAVIFFDILFFKRQELANFISYKKIPKFSSKINYKNLLVILSPFLMCAFTYLSWIISLRILNITSPDKSLLIQGIFTPEFKSNVILYIDVVKSMFIEYRYFSLTLFVLGYGILASNRKAIKRKVLIQSIVLIFVYLLCLFVYCFFLFAVCNTIPTVFLATQGLRRYLFTLVAANIFLVLFLYIHFLGEKSFVSITIVLILILWFTTPAERQSKEFIKGNYTSEALNYREQYDSINKIINIVHPTNDIVYFVGKEEIDPYISNFNTFPLTLSIFPSWNENLSLDEYREYLKTKPNIPIYPISTQLEKDYNSNKQKGSVYVYIYKATPEFKTKYQNLFESEIENEKLYKMFITDKSLLFKKIEYEESSKNNVLGK